MKLLTKMTLMGAGLALAACSGANRFDNPGADAVTQNPSFDQPQTADLFAGTANDPASPAYFQAAVGDRVLFPVDQHVLNADAQAILRGQANWLKANPDFTAVIEGHADEQGTRQYNIALGERRAESAKAFLLSEGIEASRLKTVSFGKERPVEICSDEACYAKNRRSVTVLATGLTS